MTYRNIFWEETLFGSYLWPKLHINTNKKNERKKKKYIYIALFYYCNIGRMKKSWYFF